MQKLHRPTSTDEISHSRIALAGVVVAFAGAAATLYAEYVVLSTAGHSGLYRRGLWESGGQVLAALPFIAFAVLTLGVPLGLIADQISRRYLGQRWASVGVFFVFGVIAGAIMCGPFGLDLVFGIPAAVAAPLARVGAHRLARSRSALALLSSACLALSCTTLAIWALSPA